MINYVFVPYGDFLILNSYETTKWLSAQSIRPLWGFFNNAVIICNSKGSKKVFVPYGDFLICAVSLTNEEIKHLS